MPNHVYNELSIHPAPGRESDFTTESNRLIGLVKSDETILDFNNVIPMPEELRDIQVGGKNEDKKGLRRKYGTDNWVEWRTLNWGTHWNAYSENGWVRGKEQVSIEFDTAWSAPIPVFEELCRRFPSLSLRLEFREEGENFSQCITFGEG